MPTRAAAASRAPRPIPKPTTLRRQATSHRHHEAEPARTQPTVFCDAGTVSAAAQLGSHVRFLGVTWRVLYTGPVLHHGSPHVGLLLVPSLKLDALLDGATTTLPSSAETEPLAARGERCAAALVSRVQEAYKTAGGRTDHAIVLSEDECDALALADALLEASEAGWWSDGTAADDGSRGSGIRYFAVPEGHRFAVLVPWATVEADLQTRQATRAVRLDVLQSVATDRGSQPFGAQVDAGPTVGSTRSLLLRRGTTTQLNSTTGSAGTVEHRSKKRLAAASGEEDTFGGWGSEEVSDEAAVVPFGSPPTRMGSEGEGVRSVQPCLADVHEEVQAQVVASNTPATTKRETSDATVAALPSAVPRPECRSVAVQTLSSAFAATDQETMSSDGGSPLDSSMTVAAVEKFHRHCEEALTDLRQWVCRVLASDFAERALNVQTRLWSAVESLTMRAPAKQPPIPGVDCGAHTQLDDDDGTMHQSAAENAARLCEATDRQRAVEAAATTPAIDATRGDERASLLRAFCGDDCCDEAIQECAHRAAILRLTLLAQGCRSDALACGTSTAVGEIDDRWIDDRCSAASFSEFAQHQAAIAAAARPVWAFLATRRGHEPLFDTTLDQEELVRETVDRLLFDATELREQANQAEREGDVDEYEQHMLAQVERLQAAQDAVQKACVGLYPPILEALVDKPKRFLLDVRVCAGDAIQRCLGQLEVAIDDTRHRRAKRLLQLDETTSRFIRDSYITARTVGLAKTEAEDLRSEQRGLVATITEALGRLSVTADRLRQVEGAAANEMQRREAALVAFEQQRASLASATWEAHRQVLALQTLQLFATESLQSLTAERSETEMARIMESQRIASERSTELHLLHMRVQCQLRVNVGELMLRKKALQRRIEQRVAEAEAGLKRAAAVLDEHEGKQCAIRRDELQLLHSTIDDNIASLNDTAERSRSLFDATSRPPLLMAGKAIEEPGSAIALLEDVNRQRIQDAHHHHHHPSEPCGTGLRAADDPQAASAPTDSAVAEVLASAQHVVATNRLAPPTPGYNPFHSTADPHDPQAVD